MSFQTLIKRRYRSPAKTGIGMSIDARHVTFIIYGDVIAHYGLKAKQKIEIQIGADSDAGKVRLLFNVKDGRSLVAGSSGGRYMVLSLAPWPGGPREPHRVVAVRYSQFDNGVLILLPERGIRPQKSQQKTRNSFLETAGVQ